MLFTPFEPMTRQWCRQGGWDRVGNEGEKQVLLHEIEVSSFAVAASMDMSHLRRQGKEMRLGLSSC